MDKRQSKPLVIRALLMAINIRKPPQGLIHHSNRGSQYASLKYQASLKLIPTTKRARNQPRKNKESVLPSLKSKR